MKNIFTLIISLIVTLSVNAQECVDLGLSVNWATHNIGAQSTVDAGTIYIQGTDIEASMWKNYKKVKISPNQSDYSGDPLRDPVTIMWGDNWRTPTYDDWQELIDKCSWKLYKYVNEQGIECKGYEVTGPNGNAILLPATPTKIINCFGEYQCSTPYAPQPETCTYSCCFLNNYKVSLLIGFRPSKKIVTGYWAPYRPVCNK